MNLRKFVLQLIQNTWLEIPVRDLYDRLSFTKGADYDRQTSQFIHQNLAKDSNCIDIGCYRGQILQLMVAAAPEGRHLAFEPVPANVTYLNSRFASENVEILKFALSNKQGSATFNFLPDHPARSGLNVEADEEIQTLEVDVTTLDKIVPDMDVVFVKIDVEGNELKVLEGGIELIKRTRPLVLVEFDRDFHEDPDQAGAAMFDLMASIGFSLTTLEKYLLPSKNIFNKPAFMQNFLNREDFYYVAFPSN